MENYHYKNRVVEIFTADIGGKWTSAFMIDGTGADVFRAPSFDSRGAVAEAAKIEAERLIDSDNECLHSETLSETESRPTGISVQ